MYKVKSDRCKALREGQVDFKSVVGMVFIRPDRQTDDLRE